MSEPQPSLRLLPPRPQPPLPPLSPSGERAREALAAGENLVILGAPRTGKSTLAMQLLIEAVQNGRDALILAPTRARADYLRQRVAPILGSDGGGKVRVRTPASWALSVVSEFLTARPSPLPAPVLLVGAQEDAALAAMIRPEDWAPLPPDAVRTRAFRSELRNLLARAGELGISADDLETFGVPIWNQAAPILRAWDAQGRASAERRTQVRKIDSVRLQDRAIEALRDWRDEEIFAERPQPELLIVDDYQDCTAATGRLLRYLATRNPDGGRTQIVVLGNPDLAVETFRGGAPSLLLEAETQPEIAATRLVLRESFAAVPALAALWEAEASPIPVSGTALHRYPRLQIPRGELPDAERSPSSTATSPADASVPLPDGERSPSSPAHGPVELVVASSFSQEVAHVARTFRAEHIAAGTPWSDMAVVVRSSGMARQLGVELSRRGVPVRSSQPAVLFRRENVSAALLSLARAALNGDLTPGIPRKPELLTEFLTGPLVGLSSVELRRVRRHLLAYHEDPYWEDLEDSEEDEAAPLAPELLDPGHNCVDILPIRPIVLTSMDRLALVVYGGPDAAKEWAAGLTEPTLQTIAQSLIRAATMAQRAKDVVHVGRKREDARVDIEELLWALWDGSGRATQWQELALGTGREYSALAEAAERDLDIVTALFKRAEVWSERNPEGRAEDFLAELAAEEVPSDSVAPQGVRPESVEVLTPASAVGRHWPVVAVMGVNADTWPNTRLRDSLLRAGHLVDVVLGLAPAGQAEDPEALLAARQTVRADERRMFLAAISRASRRLIVSASQERDSSPSAFFLDIATLLARAAQDPEATVEALTQVRPDVGDLTLRGITSELRHALLLAEMPDATEEQRAEGEAAAALLARLAAEGVDVADPQLWAGVQDAPSVPLVEPGQPVTLSPSAIERINDCPLQHFLTKNGADQGSTDKSAIGTAIHAVAERAQREGLRSQDELLRTFHQELLAMGLPQYVNPRSHWDRKEAEFREAQIAALADYFVSYAPLDRPAQVEVNVDHELAVPGVEVPVLSQEQPVPDEVPVRIRGRMDRMEYHNAVAKAGEAPPGTPAEKTLPVLLDGDRLPQGEGQRIVLRDFKSGKTPPSDTDARRNMQLASYRLALTSMGYDVGDAALVYLRDLAQPSAELRPKDGRLDNSPDEGGVDWAAEQVAFAAQTLGAERVLATTGSHCQFCPVKDSCPAQADGLVSAR